LARGTATESQRGFAMRPPKALSEVTSTAGRRLRRWLPLGVIVTATVVVFAMGWHTLLTFENLALRRHELRAFVAEHTVLALLIYAGAYVAIAALSLPGAGVLTITGGLLFGVWLGAPTSIVAATLGATILFLVARTTLGAALAERAGPWLERFRDGFAKEGLSYMLFLRLVPFPFFIINIAPALLGVPLRTFVLGTFLGIIPGTFAISYLGDTLDRILIDAMMAHEACVASKGAGACKLSLELDRLPLLNIAVALSLIGVVALIPPTLKKWRARHAAG
jgi:uncharacterized membrane protein YdjX (TVP38/TMEM64 family)